MGDPVDLISSGPTAPDRSSFQDAISVIKKYTLSEKLNKPVMEYLEGGARLEKRETPKPGDTFFDNTRNIIIAGNKDAVQGGIDQALKEGFSSSILPEGLIGEASQVGANLANELMKLSSSSSRPACFITGGETTVTLPDSPAPGKGGRNLELSLGAVKVLDGAADLGLITLATDGEDGVTNAAGAVVTGKTYQRGLKLGLDPDDYLVRHDSYTYFESIDDLIKIGLTRTNVNDLCFLFLLKGN
jgi:hydroxypyruvate reductase